jgi:hypothetical protein
MASVGAHHQKCTFLDREKFHASFASDLSAEEATFTADSQFPWGVEALSDSISLLSAGLGKGGGTVED